MMKFSHFLMSRMSLSEKLLLGKFNNIKTDLWVHNFISRAGISSGRPSLTPEVSSGNHSSNVYAAYTLFKGKAALSVSPIMPKFIKLGSGGFKVDKKGCLLLTFWPAVGERKYNWEKKQVFALSPTELGSLMSLGPGKSCEFFHDPSMKSSNAGQVRKSLSVTPHPDDSGYHFSLSVVNTILKTNERLGLPVTKAEYTVMCTAFSFILPQIIGWDQFSNQLPTSTLMPPVRQPVIRESPDLEWDR